MKELWPVLEHTFPEGLQPMEGLTEQGKSLKRKEQQRGTVMKRLQPPTPHHTCSIQGGSERR